MENKMFCFQCQETAGCKGCTKIGVCGKKPEVSNMQDLLVFVTKGLAAVAVILREEGKEVGNEINHIITLNLFTTITNANFDKNAVVSRIKETLKIKNDLTEKLSDKSKLSDAALWNGSESEFEEKAKSVGVLSTENDDIRSLKELVTYGLKGLAAYLKHANVLLNENADIDKFLQSALAKTLDDTLICRGTY